MVNSSSDKELQESAATNISTLIDCGFVKPYTTIKLKDKKEIVQAVALHHVILRCKAELDQFADGLNSCGVLRAIRCYSCFTRNYFTIEGHPSLTSGDFCAFCVKYI